MKQFLTFQIGDETYGIIVNRVREVLEAIRITRVPRASAVLLGVFNLRGAVVPAMDLPRKLGIEGRNTGFGGTIVAELKIPGGETVAAGLMVDQIDRVISVNDEQVLPPPVIGSSSDNRMFSGVIRRDGEESFIMLIDTERLVGEEDLIPDSGGD